MADTSAPYSEAMIATAAASLLDEYHVTSLDDDTPIARFLAREFGLTRDELMQAFPWPFAKARAVLSPTTEPAFGWTYAYNLPTDLLRVDNFSANGVFNEAPSPCEVEGEQLLTNIGPKLYLKYTKRFTTASKFSPLFCRALACKLAMYGATRITGKESRYQKASAEYGRAVAEARVVHSIIGSANSQYYNGTGDYDNVLTVRG